jgi:glycosyltransferase involved in cell wall biosynthesis
MPDTKTKLAILVNTVAPYRLPIYASLANTFDTLLLHGGKEPNRTWEVNLPKSLKARRVFTLQIPYQKKTGTDGVSDTAYLHLNIGLVWWLIRFRPDAIIANEMGLRTLIATVYGWFASVPVWVWWGGTLYSERNITPVKRSLRSFLARCIKHWISYGATTTEYLTSIGVPHERILQIQNCVPQETFQVVPSKPAGQFNNTQRPVILSVGQLVPRKGMDKLIEACGRLTKRGLQFSLILVGQGTERDHLQALAKENGLEQFEILPNQPQAVLNQMYRTADVFVFPTLEDVWGLVVNEAMWAGIPVLCSKYAGCAPELLPESNIFDPLSEESFDRSLSRVFKERVCPPDQARLLTWQQVSEMICRSLQNGVPSGELRYPLHEN